MGDIARNVERVRSQVAEACARCGRRPEDVTLIAVSKTVGCAAIEEAVASGIRHFGENRVQEAEEKVPVLPADLCWHMIGTLQSNKVKKAVSIFRYIHSVDRPSLVEALSRLIPAGQSIEVFMQVNVALEATKHGVTPQEAPALARAIAESGLRLVGLMTVAPYTEDPESVRPVFRRLRHLALELEKLRLPGAELKYLSMGMSGDFAVAIEEGATHVRIGSAIFGPRG